jgi:hypothetical protein
VAAHTFDIKYTLVERNKGKRIEREEWRKEVRERRKLYNEKGKKG